MTRAHTPEHLPPTSTKKQIAHFEKEICAGYSAIKARFAGFHDEVVYDIVGLGVWLQKAKVALGHGEFCRLFKNETVSHLGMTVRTAQNYMNAALTAGLTHKSTQADVEKLRKAKALHGKKPTDLYRLPAAKEAPAEPKRNLRVECLVALRQSCDHILGVRGNLNKAEFDTACARVLKTLEDLTGCPWSPDPDGERERDEYKEHAECYELS